MPSTEKGDPDQIPLPSPSRVALPVVSRQPQQKSGRAQPETKASLPLQGMLCFLRAGMEKLGFDGKLKKKKATEVCQS